MSWIGRRVGELEVVEHLGVHQHFAWLKLRCDCGNHVVVVSRALYRGKSECCTGCPLKWQREHLETAEANPPSVVTVDVEAVLDEFDINRIG